MQRLPVPALPVHASILKPVLITGGCLLAGQWVLSDVMHVPGGGFGLVALAGGLWWLQRSPSTPNFAAPETLDGWIERCRLVLDQFSSFEADSEAALRRESSLEAVLSRSGPPRLAHVGVDPSTEPEPQALLKALACETPLSLSLCEPLDRVAGERIWPAGLQEQDLILFSVSAPLLASDLLWLQRIPEDQPAWLLVRGPGNGVDQSLGESLQADLPERWRQRVLLLDAEIPLRSALDAVRQELRQGRFQTQKRLLVDLHRRWQAELEMLRRERFQDLQQRTQWIVAGTVLASPLPSLDLLALAVANGLMIREMAEIWGVSLQPDTLREAALQLAKTALTQGVVEWSSQMLLGLAKFEAGSWLIAGTMQSLSAAYLTRVVGRSMADWLALCAGVSEPDLLELKQQAPLLVAHAAEAERLDWNGFVKQSNTWLRNAAS